MRPSCLRTALLSSAALLCAVAGGCGGGGFTGEGGEGSASGSVRMLVNITPNLTQEFWDELVKPFEEANPGVDVIIEAPTGEGVSDTLQQQLAAGDPPDVVETLMADDTLRPHLLDLSGQPWADETPLATKAALDGRIYTVGVGEQAQSLIFYNKTAFTEAGITEPPKTFGELTEAMSRLKDAGYLPLQTAGDFVTGLQLLQLANPSLAQTHPQWYRGLHAGKLTVGESMLPYLRQYKSWIDRGYVDENALGMKYPDAQTNFLSGRSAMFVMGSWFTATEAQADNEFEVGVFPAPVRAGQSYPGPQGATMAAPYMIMKSTEQRSLALDLVEWLVTDRHAIVEQLEQDGNFRRGVQRQFTPLEREVQSILDNAPGRVAQGEGYGDETLPRGFNAAWNDEVQGLYIGRSPETVGANVDRWVASHS